MAKSLRFAKSAVGEVIKFARSEGWAVKRTQGGHIRFFKRGYPPIFTASTPSDYRTKKNAIARLKRVMRHKGEEA